MTSQPSPSVVVASRDLGLLDELIRHLEEFPHWRLVASARSPADVARAIAQHSPDAVVLAVDLAGELSSDGPEWQAAHLVVVGREERLDSLRVALALGARGFVRWPEERQALRELVEDGLPGPPPRPSPRGRLTALWGPKGGSGTSVLCAHLSAALARLGARCLLLDLDLDHGDLAAILGAEREPKSLADVLRVIDEITPAALETVAWRHPDGFALVPSPATLGEADLTKVPDIMRAVAAARDAADHIVADVPSGASELAFALAEEATSLIVVVTPDLLSLRRAKQAVDSLHAGGIETRRIELAVNRASPGDITDRDIAAVIGRPVAASIRADLGLLKAPDRGQLAESGRRLLEPLAHRLVGSGTRPAPQRRPPRVAVPARDGRRQRRLRQP